MSRIHVHECSECGGHFGCKDLTNPECKLKPPTFWQRLGLGGFHVAEEQGGICLPCWNQTWGKKVAKLEQRIAELKKP